MGVVNSDNLDTVTQKYPYYQGLTYSYTASNIIGSRIEDTTNPLDWMGPRYRFTEYKTTGWTHAFLDWMNNRHTRSLFLHDDFIGETLRPEWDTAIVGASTATLIPGVGGILDLSTSGFQNDEIQLFTGGNPFLIRDHNFWLEAQFAYIGNTHADSALQFGCWFDANNYLFIRRFGNAAGLGSFRVDSMNGGVFTTWDLGFEPMPITEYQRFAIASNRTNFGAPGTATIEIFYNDQHVLQVPAANVPGTLFEPMFRLVTTADMRKTIYLDYVKCWQVHPSQLRPVQIQG